MNVLVWSSYVASIAGGQERISLELALRLRQAGCQVVLVGPFDNAPELRQRIPNGLPYYPFDLYRGHIRPHGRAGKLLRQLIREYRVEVISAHGSILAPRLAGKMAGIPMAWTVHGVQAVPTSWTIQAKTKLFQYLLTGRGAHAVLVSHATATAFSRHFPTLPASKRSVIHNGAIDEAALAHLPIKPAGPPWQLGFVGRLVERKRPLDLVQLAGALRGRLDYRFHVFGDGPLEPALRAAIAERGLADRFVLHGYWRQGSAGMFEQVHLLVHTDCVEPFGGAVLEAQLAARPVAAYAVGGNPEIVEHGQTGWLTPLGDIPRLAESVVKLVGAEYAAVAARAQERARAKFSLDRMTREYQSLFERLRTG